MDEKEEEEEEDVSDDRVRKFNKGTTTPRLVESVGRDRNYFHRK